MTRLSVGDPASGGGHQPLIADGAALVCNGMIYNDRLLRARIGPDRFQTAGDSESILQGYLAWGTDNLQRVDRMTMAQSLEARVPFLDRGTGKQIDYPGIVLSGL